MNIKDMQVETCERKEIKDFIETHHYSHNINGLISDYCFKLMHNGEMIGAMIYGKFGMANVWKRYAENKDDVIELRRMVCIDETPKNTESYFIGKTIKYIKLNTDIKTIISYADNEFNHEGTIYKATNFKKIGETSKGKVIMFEGKRYHDKTIRTKYKGELKPFAKRVKEALACGDAFYHITKTKNIYELKINRKTRVCKGR